MHRGWSLPYATFDKCGSPQGTTFNGKIIETKKDYISYGLGGAVVGAVAGAVESAYGATVLLSSARNMGSDMQKLGDAMSSPEDAGESLTNGARMTINKALDAADDFLGAGYKEVAPGVLRSKDGLRQVRMTDADITGAHGSGAHMNFETGKSIVNPNGRVTFKVTDNMHIYLTD